MNLLIGIILTVFVMTSLAAEQKQTMNQWIADVKNPLYGPDDDNYCVMESKQRVKVDGDMLLDLASAKVKFSDAYKLCMEHQGKIRGQLNKLAEKYEFKNNLKQIYCYKMELNHTEFVIEEDNKNSKQIRIADHAEDKKEVTEFQLDSIKFGSHCNETDADHLKTFTNNFSLGRKYFAYSFRNYSNQFICKVPNSPYKQWLHLEKVRILYKDSDNSMSKFLPDILREYLNIFKNDLKCDHIISYHEN